MPVQSSKFIPTLTQIVGSTDHPAVLSGSVAPSQAQIQKRVLELVHLQLDQTLERQLREVVSALALAHAHTLVQQIRPAIESAVQKIVAQAVREALAQAMAQK